MSSSARPIPAHLFAEALKDLPLSNIYAKASELQNSITHLAASNAAMAPFAADGDNVCAEAIAENEGVLARMRERVALCRAEAEGRGAAWSAHAVNGADAGAEPGETSSGSGGGLANGHASEAAAAAAAGAAGAGTTAPRPAGGSGRLTDEELRRQLEARMGGGDGLEDEGEEDEGVHL